MKNSNLIETLNKELTRLYHNATPSGELRCESDFEADLFDECFELKKEMGLEMLGIEFQELIQKYGDIEQYGRGGRTLAPNQLMNDHGPIDSSSMKDLPKEEMQWLAQELKRFNDCIIRWNRTTPDMIIRQIRKEYASEIQKNKNKKRVTRTVVSYE
jgi:hypothetical protein